MLKACAKEGLIVKSKEGKGSHAKVFNEAGKFTIVQHKLHKIAVRRLLKELKNLGVNVENIVKHLMF